MPLVHIVVFGWFYLLSVETSQRSIVDGHQSPMSMLTHRAIVNYNSGFYVVAMVILVCGQYCYDANMVLPLHICVISSDYKVYFISVETIVTVYRA